ncbi:hypothetical protein SAMN04487965_3695 [Microbulbifer donghaiensis]|uniref:Uncharacterized protein n=1 Tax=Microbulbifer donghaiensis TaxID=494016 RepID=A0A1M5IKC4_9GAMM|nr:hypothetical protein SAMN04487965_3695 [Microbulbifer donghaiensis]
MKNRIEVKNLNEAKARIAAVLKSEKKVVAPNDVTPGNKDKISLDKKPR